MQERYALFNDKMPGEEGTIGYKATEAMRRGRLTWVESRLLISLMLSRIPVNRPKAIDEINEVSDTFETAGIEAEQVQPILWNSCQHLVRNNIAPEA